MALLAAATSGCGRENRVEVHPVTGKVTYQGRPAAGALVVFHDVVRGSEELHQFPIPRATTDAAGVFRVSSYGNDDGAPTGSYRVTVELPNQKKLPPAADSAANEDVDPEAELSASQSEVPPAAAEPVDVPGTKYSDPGTTPLKCDVKPGDNRLPPFELD